MVPNFLDDNAPEVQAFREYLQRQGEAEKEKAIVGLVELTGCPREVIEAADSYDEALRRAIRWMKDEWEIP